MSLALLELLVRSIRGRFVRRFRLLRQPKYLIGFVIGVGYVGFFLLRSRIGSEGPFFVGRSSVLLYLKRQRYGLEPPEGAPAVEVP